MRLQDRLRPRRLLASLLLLGLALPALQPLPALSSARSSSLSAALEAIREQHISADIHFLASDEMRGRYTPSPELAIAARFLRARIQRLGFEPGAPEGFLYEYHLAHRALDAAATRVELRGAQGTEVLIPGEGFFYSRGNLGKDGDVAGKLVHCGGASRQELKGIELDGRWALVADDGEGSGSYRHLRSSGALGVVVVPGKDYAGEPYPERFARSTEQLIEGSYAYSPPESERRSVPPFPQIYLPAGSLARLLAMAGLPTGELPAVGSELGVELAEQRRLLGGGNASVVVENVCGLWRGSDPVLAQEVILVSAHYDHIGVQGGEICNGADDNGSGTTGLLAVAEGLVAHGPFRRSVMLIWVSGEERGLWGSAAWTDRPWLPEGLRVVANLNIDMIGRNAPDELYITPSPKHEKHNGIVRMAQRLAPLEGFPELGDADKFYGRSDQANFANLGIPVAFLFSGLHDDYHRPSDTPDKIDCDKVRRVARLVVRLLDALQGDELAD